MGHSIYDPGQDQRTAWNAGRKTGAKRPLKPKQVWAIRFWLERRGGGLDDFAFPSRADPTNTSARGNMRGWWMSG